MLHIRKIGIVYLNFIEEKIYYKFLDISAVADVILFI